MKKLLTHLGLLLGLVIILTPIYMAFVASTQPLANLLSAPIPMLPGHAAWHNYREVLQHGLTATGGQPVLAMLWRSFVMALIIALGKIVLAIFSAYGIVYFRFLGRKVLFALIFLTLMLPVEVRIVPTFQVVASLGFVNSYAGLTLPLIASATATFLFRQFFLTIPDELTEAARIDGAGPMRFFFDAVLPLSRSNILSLFIIMFIYGWDQYLWPLVITTQANMSTIVMGIQRLASVADQVPQWNSIMAIACLAMLPPIIIIIVLQRWFIAGLIETEK